MIARISGVRAVEGGTRLLVEIEVAKGAECTRETLSLLTARLTQIPRIGEIGEEELENLRHGAAVSAAVATGLRVLGACGCSKRHLMQKLRTRGVSLPVAAQAVEELAEKGYLREEEGAVREAERALAKLWGDRRILLDLQAKGYSGGALKYAMARLRDEDRVARCVQLIRKQRMARPETRAQAQKLCASLTRYGYTGEEIRAALRYMGGEFPEE